MVKLSRRMRTLVRERCVVEEKEPGIPAGADQTPPASSGLSDRGARATRIAVRALVVVAAGVIAAGILGWEAGALVAGLTVLTYLLLAALAPRTPLPYGMGRLLRALRRNGYYIISLPAGFSGSRHRYLTVGPAGAFLLDVRNRRRYVTWEGGEWRIGDRPLRRIANRFTQRAEQLERRLRLRDLHAELDLVPVLVVGGGLPEPAMRSGQAVIARPRNLVRHVIGQPDVLESADVDAAAAGISDRMVS
ncbi:hypothetical protein [Spiractinospora alimapuensis]|uniref:hypothetical protein n=1 Tax=Spiractinospora alimapuensis TaxID=2820884 RepID=UPI001F36AAC0|nr:hypothetical protein [Spiractinospora alimapuensis]